MQPPFADMPSLLDWTQFIAFRAACGLLEPFPPERNLRTARIVADLAMVAAPKRLERATTNVVQSFPDMPRAEAERIARESIRHTIQTFMVDAIVAPRIVQAWSWQRHVRFGDFDEALDLLVSDRPCIFLTAHIGNWELLGYVLALIGFRMTALARPLDNPLVSDWLFRQRQASGLAVITKWGASEELQRIVESGGKIAFIADQNAGDDGIFVPFLGRLASSYKSIGLLAMRYRLPIVAGFARRLGESLVYELSATDVIRPEDWESADDPLYLITARYNHAMERMVLACPEQYLWMHRRWKSRPRHEREGKPMPARLREKIRSLPWREGRDLEE